MAVETIERLLRFKLGKTRRDVDRLLRRRVTVAYRHVPAYRALLDEFGASPGAIRFAGDLPQLPIMHKERLFLGSDSADILSDRATHRHLTRVSTGGSTSLPLNVYMSRSEATYRRVLLLGAWYRVSPLPMGLRIADLGTQHLRRGASRILRISIALPIEQQVALLRDFRPHVVSGYPTATGMVAREMVACPLCPAPRLVALRGEVLHDDVRETIEAAFGCRASDFYNCEEIGNIAWPCSADPTVLHVNTDACILEVVDADGRPVADGIEGQIAVTNLYNDTMPFIRYDLHDRGVLLPADGTRCACGSRARRMRPPSGRDDDSVYLPDGRRVSPRLIATAINRAFEIDSQQGGYDRHFRRFQVIQDDWDHFTVRIVPEPRRELDYADVVDRALKRIHPAIRSSVAIEEEIPFEPSGKFRKVIRRFDPLAGDGACS